MMEVPETEKHVLACAKQTQQQRAIGYRGTSIGDGNFVSSRETMEEENNDRIKFLIEAARYT
ncbi:hypothetical protein A2U01_0016533 [Trifolium medium]|uniref:Uncharacterized protein n=1 Tax=Trifolium medium TaxID=97028 RepID=A0A392NAQ8_9FABA|nr:hypothetical protein [Trifolium medium]